MHNVILIGAGEHARVVLDSLHAAGRTVLAMIDPKFDGQQFMNTPVLGFYKSELYPESEAIVAIGANHVRQQLSQDIKHPFTTSIDKTAIVSRYATIGKGSMVLHGVILQQGTVLGKHVIVNTAAHIDHDCKISDFAHIAPGSSLCGRISVGEGALIGAGSIIIPGIKIGAWCTVGAGSVVTRDIPDHAVAVGNPARIIRYNKPA
ncbi:MAG TPA: acetyltransferase [Cyclobacteriaceae bacterium]|nr:acetyltransferase [Cyclobacteriaceae bacterium]HMV08959.1 acetyltransferase [Cyclobacteriaceae bacterium]HMV90154.1 acetyltransferase [Cyclobacteriaceae bacterium]HMX00286.1 acetyltransferase [Cyclobacteriaceae bacterium]HMX49715.1 acetyltransferase [Cyclobacteriaceae bacterium]